MSQFAAPSAQTCHRARSESVAGRHTGPPPRAGGAGNRSPFFGMHEQVRQTGQGEASRLHPSQATACTGPCTAVRTIHLFSNRLAFVLRSRGARVGSFLGGFRGFTPSSLHEDRHSLTRGAVLRGIPFVQIVDPNGPTMQYWPLPSGQVNGSGLRRHLPTRSAPYASYLMLVDRLAPLLHPIFRPAPRPCDLAPR